MLRIRLSYWPVLLLTLWGCRKDVEQFQPYAPSAQALNNLLAEQIPAASAQTKFTLNYLSTDKTLETPSGTRVFLIDTDHLFQDKATGQPVLCSTCQELTVEITEVFDKSDMIARGLFTQSEDGTLFRSGGMVGITISCNGTPLALLPDRTLKVQLPNNSPEIGYSVFYLHTSNTSWTMSNQEAFEAEWPNASGITLHGYELLVKNLGWAACGQLLADPTSTFCVTLPSGFGGQNTLAYLVFKNEQVVAPLEFDLGQNKFCYEFAPLGFQVQLAAVSKLGQQYWLGKAQTEIGTGATYPLNTQQMTEEAVLNFVKSL